MTPDFRSEYGEDEWLMANYGDFFQTPRFYVDVGCADPGFGSNTAFLRSLGWWGLNIDGDKDWERHWGPGFIHAIVSNVPRVHFEVNAVHCLSRVTDLPPNATTVPLSTLLEMAGVDKIGLLSIDVEGHEYEVINSFDITRYWPSFILSEYNTLGIGEDYSVKHYLEALGYRTIHQTVANLIYALSPPDQH